MPLQVTMKRTVLVLFALVPVLAAMLAGCGLAHVAGSVLLGGGGLTFTLMMALAFIGARGPVKAPRAAVTAAKPAVTTMAPAKAPAKARAKAVVVAVAPEARAPEIEEVAAFFVQAATKNAASKRAEPAVDDFGADELAFFAEGENQTMRASDSSPHWHLG